MQPSVAHITTIDRSLRYLLLSQLQSIRRDGYEVVGISSPGSDVDEIRAAGIRHIPVTMFRKVTPLRDLVALWQLYRVMKRENFTIVHTHTPKPGLLGQLAARLAGVPVVVNTLHGFYFHERMHPVGRRFFITLEKIAARCSDVILSQNSEDIETAIREGICPPDRIKYLGNGIDVHRFDPECLDGLALEQTRRKLGLSSDNLVVGFVGRLVAEKGLPELLQAARSVAQQVPSARFLIVGATDYDKRDALPPQVADKYGVADVCIFAGWHRDMPELYALMDVSHAARWRPLQWECPVWSPTSEGAEKSSSMGAMACWCRWAMSRRWLMRLSNC
jgi:glycosyltransferase involved in cell wall biosynthesis